MGFNRNFLGRITEKKFELSVLYPIYPKRLGSICTPVITAIFGPRLASLSNIALISSTEASSPGYGVLVINAASDIFGRIISASEQE